MRRLVIATVVAAVLGGTAGCSGDSPQQAGTAAPGTATSPSAGPADQATGPSEPAGGAPPRATGSARPTTGSAPQGSRNTREICAEVERLNSTSSAKISATLRTFIDKAAKGQSVTQAESDKVLKDMTALARQWGDKIEQQSAKATDPALRTAVNDLASDLKPLETGTASIQQMGEIVQKAKTDLARFCG